jgi:hypothetical protein
MNLTSATEIPVAFPERQQLSRYELTTAAAAIVIIAFLAHFYLFDQFGLYEDDYLMVFPWLHVSWHKVAGYALDSLVHPMQGRPIYFPLQALLAYFAFRIGGLGLTHLVSFGLLALLGSFVYRVLRQVTSPRIAFLASLIFVLYPADTSRQIIMHQCATLLPMCICMYAILLYARGRQLTSYVVAALTLLIYESTYFPFLLAPLFTLRKRPLALSSALRHVGLFFAVAGGMFLIRIFLGESRTQEVSGSFFTGFPKLLMALCIGPLSSGFLLLQRPIDAYMHGQPGHWFIMIVSAAVTAFCFGRLSKYDLKDNVSFSVWPWLIASGCLAWTMSYLLDFRPDYFPPVVSIGRLSAVHEVGAFGCAVAFAGVFSSLDQAWKQPLRRAAHFATVAIAAGLCGFGYEIQLSEYVASWHQQREFWRELVPLIQDITPGEVVVCAFDKELEDISAPRGLSQLNQAMYNYFAFPRFLTLPARQTRPPTLHSYFSYTRVEVIDGILTIKSPFFDQKFWAKVPGGEVIFIKVGKARIERISGEINLQGYRVFAKPPNGPFGKVEFTKLFHELFEGASEIKWWSLRNASSHPPGFKSIWLRIRHFHP